MHPIYNKERRSARAKALINCHASDDLARYVDAAEYQHEAFVVTIVRAITGETTIAASTRCTKEARAEEVATALAITTADCMTIISDSRTAVQNFTKGSICREAARILRHLPPASSRNIKIKWTSAHEGEDVSGTSTNHETALVAARAISHRAATPSHSVEWFCRKD